MLYLSESGIWIELNLIGLNIGIGNQFRITVKIRNLKNHIFGTLGYIFGILRKKTVMKNVNRMAGTILMSKRKRMDENIDRNL